LENSFWGVVNDRHRRECCPSTALHGVWRGSSAHEVRVFASDYEGVSDCPSSNDTRDSYGPRLEALVYGNLYVGSDTDFGPATRMEALDQREASGTLERLFRQHGLEALERLDGNFNALLHLPDERKLILVVDKFGCNDIFYRIESDSLVFATHPALVAPRCVTFDPVAVAFFLAQESFIPAPFTLMSAVRSVGRARCMIVEYGEGGLKTSLERYWQPKPSWDVRTRSQAISVFGDLLSRSIDLGIGSRTALMLSGGVDSSLLLGLTAPKVRGELVTITWVTKGFSEDETANAKAAKLARDFSLPHVTVAADPACDSLPEEWDRAASSWMSGGRITTPLWYRLGNTLKARFGEGYCVLSGQGADTLADNNYTSPSWGYLTRRTLYSSWFLRLLPFLRHFAPPMHGSIDQACSQLTASVAGPRIAGMVKSVLGGLGSRNAFYGGRLFGYGEMPGLARQYYPILSDSGFDQVTGWYQEHFLDALVKKLDPSTFYRLMIEMSMDMVMLHLDSRLIFHALGASGGRVRLPFLDSRMVNFFGSLPYCARACYRSAKDVVRSQPAVRRLAGQKPTAPRPQRLDETGADEPGVDEVLLRGSLGEHFRSMFKGLTFINRTPNLFDYLDERHFDKQISAFQRGDRLIDFRLINKIASLEHWARQLSPTQV
jgi:Asparagine synthase